MGLQRKIILTFCMAALLFFMSLTGTILYYYHHPSSIKPLIEKSISRYTGSLFQMKNLSYSIRPLSVRLEGITLKPLKDHEGFHLEIPRLDSHMVLEGAFGHKTLIVEELKMEGFSLRFSDSRKLLEILPKGTAPSFLAQGLKRVIALVLFRDIEFQKAEVSAGSLSARLGDKTVQVTGIRASLSPDRLIAVTCGMEMEWPSQRLRVTVPDVQITTDKAVSIVDPEVGFQLAAQKLTLETPDMNTESIDLKAKLNYDHSQGRLTFEPIDLHIESINLKQGSQGTTTLLNVNLNTAGRYNLAEKHVETSRLILSANDFFELKGKLQAGFQAPGDIDFELLDSRVTPSKLLPILPVEIRKNFAPFTLSAPIFLVGGVQGKEKPEKWLWHGNLQVRLNQNRFSYADARIQLNGRFTGSIQAEGKLPELDVSVGIKGDETSLSAGGVNLKPTKVEMRLSLSGEHPVYQVKDLAFQIPRADVTVGGKAVRVDDIGVNARKGKLDAVKKSLFFPEIRLESSLLKNLLLSLAANEEQAVIKLRGKNANVVQAASLLGVLPSGWELNGLDSIQAEATIKNSGQCSFSSKLDFQELGIQNVDGTILGEKVAARAETNGEINLKQSSVSAHTNLKIDGGEILYNRFYFDLGRNPLLSDCQATYRFSERSLKLSSLNFELKEILAFDLRGTLLEKARHRHLEFLFNIPETPMRPVFRHFVLEPFRTEKPFLTDLNTGGTISTNLRLTGTTEDWMITGRCTWHDGRLISESMGLSVQGIDLDFPIWSRAPVTVEDSQIIQSLRDSIQRGSAASGNKKPHYVQITNTAPTSSLVARNAVHKKETLKGKLSIQSIALPMLPEQSLTIPVDAEPNRISVNSQTILKIPGGEVRLGPVLCTDLIVSRPSIETSLTMDAFELQPLFSRLWSQPIQGIAEGRLDSIHLKGDTVASRGKMELRVFGGEMILSDFGASGIFTSAPLFRLNARFDDLDLSKLTKGTAFGKIEGALRGHVLNLEIAYGQPQRFNLLLETVEKQGEPQRISVKALDNIARIGGGQSPFMGLAGAFASLFKDFPYEKMGVRASLENDVFRINGTIKEGEKEYLVKRGGFSGVNVVNQNPDNRISFKDMVKRIKRVTEQSGGPVVK